MVASVCCSLIPYKKHNFNKFDVNKYCTTSVVDNEDKEWE